MSAKNSKVYVVDTNVVLNDLKNIYKLSENGNNIIVFPETVLVELEDKKKITGEIGYQAREFARLLARAKVKEAVHKDGYKVAKFYMNNLHMHIISKDRYETDIDTAFMSESNDKRIIEIAVLAQQYYKGLKTIFVSLDVYARMFGILKSVKTETLHDDKDVVPEFEFYKTIQIAPTAIKNIKNKSIFTFDPEHKPHHFAYTFEMDNEEAYHAIIHEEKIELLGANDFRGLSVKPMNLEQKFYMKAILSNHYDLTVIDAKAGSGKTLLAFACAMKLLDKKHYDKIIYVRNSIESLDKGADVGYLSGNDEKFRVFNMALNDTLEHIAKKMLKKKSNEDNIHAIENKILELIAKYRIEKLWPGEARGRTLSDAVVILDEWQNSSEKTTQLILSRLDNSCTAIVIGSNRQIDNIYLNKYNNGLTKLLKETKNEQEDIRMFAIELTQAVRGKYAKFSEDIFEKKKP
ncbi:MAG TPA: phosphate starvation-inducible protein PhoH [Epsilonproteobacteria bacterium]|nr:phosphate starvation-inducible protein PhoH [Campylobacterota bacterium]